jgi:hypothetical protein
MFYGLLFIEVFRQIIRSKDITESIVFGSLSGYLIIVLLATFSFISYFLLNPLGFNGIKGTSIPELYQEFTYFSVITIASIGYGDITPASTTARLLSSFWGIVGQFYMVALVGIIISKFSSKSNIIN